MYIAGYIEKVKRRVPNHDCSDKRVGKRRHVGPALCARAWRWVTLQRTQFTKMVARRCYPRQCVSQALSEVEREGQ